MVKNEYFVTGGEGVSFCMCTPVDYIKRQYRKIALKGNIKRTTSRSNNKRQTPKENTIFRECRMKIRVCQEPQAKVFKLLCNGYLIKGFPSFFDTRARSALMLSVLFYSNSMKGFFGFLKKNFLDIPRVR